MGLVRVIFTLLRKEPSKISDPCRMRKVSSHSVQGKQRSVLVSHQYKNIALYIHDIDCTQSGSSFFLSLCAEEYVSHHQNMTESG